MIFDVSLADRSDSVVITKKTAIFFLNIILTLLF